MLIFKPLQALLLLICLAAFPIAIIAVPFGSAAGPPTPMCSVYTGNFDVNHGFEEGMVLDEGSWWFGNRLGRSYSLRITPKGGPNSDLLLSVGNVQSKYNVFVVQLHGGKDLRFKVDSESQCTVEIRGYVLNGFKIAEMKRY